MIGRTKNVPLPLVLIPAFILLNILQILMSTDDFAIMTVTVMAIGFGFKSWGFFVSAYTMYRENGTSRLARAVHGFFWSLLSLSLPLTILFMFGAFDMIDANIPFTNMAAIRNSIRNVAITAVIGVMICESRMLDALFAYLRARRSNGEII